MEKGSQFEPLPEQSTEYKESETIRDEFHQAVDRTLSAHIETRQPMLPEKERGLKEVKNAEGKIIAYRDRVRPDPVREKNTDRDTWLVIDFDDVINHTTIFNDYLAERLENELGLSADEYRKIYEASRSVNPEGKKMVSFSEIMRSIKSRFPDQEEIIDSLTQGIDYSQFIDQAVKRALQGVKNLDGLNVRVSILTFGEVEYQKMRVDGSGIDEIVDDIIYTQGSKREVVEAMVKELYHDKEWPYDDHVRQPFILTVDDSPSQIEDFEQMDIKRRYVNMRFRHPQAKKYSSETSTENVVTADEKHPNQAAISLLRAVRLSGGQYFQEPRKGLAFKMRDLSVYDVGTGDAPWEKTIDVKYKKTPEGQIVVSGRIFRDPLEWANYQEINGLVPPKTYRRVEAHGRLWDESDDGVLHPIINDPEQDRVYKESYSGQDFEQTWNISEDGTLKHTDGRPAVINLEEYVAGAK